MLSLLPMLIEGTGPWTFCSFTAKVGRTRDIGFYRNCNCKQCNGNHAEGLREPEATPPLAPPYSVLLLFNLCTHGSHAHLSTILQSCQGHLCLGHASVFMHSPPYQCLLGTPEMKHVTRVSPSLCCDADVAEYSHSPLHLVQVSTGDRLIVTAHLP